MAFFLSISCLFINLKIIESNIYDFGDPRKDDCDYQINNKLKQNGLFNDLMFEL